MAHDAPWEPTATPDRPDTATRIMGVDVTMLTGDEVIGYVVAAAQRRRATTVGHVNAHAYEVMRHSDHMACFYADAELVYCDGYGVWLAAAVARQPLPPRFTGADWLWDLMKACAQSALRVFLLGGEPGVAETAAIRLKAQNPSLKIVGTNDGYFDKRADSQENLAVLEHIRESRCDVLIVGFGMPIQEEWVVLNRPGIAATVTITQGAVLDFVSENVRRGPPLMTRWGLEWLARLAVEPRRLWRRYVLGLPRFTLRALGRDTSAAVPCVEHGGTRMLRQPPGRGQQKAGEG